MQVINEDPGVSHLYTLRSDILPVLLGGEEVTSGIFPGILAVLAAAGGI
jgi:hypothetical protein